jgi:hypothetical protein
MKTYLLLFCIFYVLKLSSQPVFDSKRDYVWIFGIESGITDSVKHKFFDFRSDTMAFGVQHVTSHDLYQTNASICDTAGNFLFFSNGCVLADSGFQYFPGADTINQGLYWNAYCNKGSNRTDGYVIVNGCWILPVAERKFKVLYADIINGNFNTSGIRYSSIVQNAQSGTLIGQNQDKYALQANLQPESRGIVRHANGRDWWMINEAHQDKWYYINLIDSTETIHPAKQQFFNELPTRDFHGGTQACFTPDGTKYMTVGSQNHCQIFDFDRCTGTLSNMRFITLPVPYDSLVGVTGIAVSPSSRYMYLMLSRSIWQYDLESANIASSAIRVAQHDGYRVLLPWGSYDGPASFYQSQIGPDGKIYILPSAGRRTFTVIESPDLFGADCGVTQHKYVFPDWGIICQPPRFPNFRLGPVVGSPCDTITSANHEPEAMQARMQLRPNPATSYTVADLSVPDYSANMQLTLTVSDLSGSEVGTYAVPPYAALQRIETGGLPNGMYFVALKSRGRVIKTEKLVVLRE